MNKDDIVKASEVAAKEILSILQSLPGPASAMLTLTIVSAAVLQTKFEHITFEQALGAYVKNIKIEAGRETIQ